MEADEFALSVWKGINLLSGCIGEHYAFAVFSYKPVFFFLLLGMDERTGATSWGTSGQPSPSYESSRVRFPHNNS